MSAKQLPLWDDDGRLGRDRGIEKAEAHAEEVSPGWRDLAYGSLLAYAKAHPRVPFSTMQARKAAYAQGLPRPPTEWAWGGVVRRAVLAGHLRKSDERNIGDNTSHSKLTPLWITR